jgi:hypothetical protein
MINLSEELIDSAAPNSTAIRNARGLVRTGKFVKLYKSHDGTLIFGQCEGSEENSYFVSADFIKPEKPAYRCTCPSRQLPCKHALGLMYSYIEGKKFVEANIPQEILDKREKDEKREARKQEVPDEGSRKVNKSALAKKIRAQIEGLELLEKITCSIIRGGLASLDMKALKIIGDQAKQLENCYLPALQASLKELIFLFQRGGNREDVYGHAVDSLAALNSISKRGREYLEKKLQDENLSMDAESAMEELLGHAWQLSELKEYGRVQADAEMVQLFFSSYTDTGREEYVDTGCWIDLKDGNIYETAGYRPFKAVKYIKEEDSFFSVAIPKELYVYPGDMNKRVRWDEMNVRDASPKDLSAIKAFAKPSYPDALKAVKNHLKNPMSHKNPCMLLAYSSIGIVNDTYVMEDGSGVRIVLKDSPGHDPTCHMLPLMRQRDLHNQVALVRFTHDMDSGILSAQPLTLVTDSEIIRLAF